MNRRRLPLAGLLALAGAAGVAVGTWLPWLVVRPGYDGPVPAVHLPGMDAGLAGFDWLALAAAAVGLLGVVPADVLPVSRLGASRLGGARAAAVTILAGGAVAALAVASLLSNGFLGVFVPAAGFYLTVLGGVHVSVGGALRLRSVVGE